MIDNIGEWWYIFFLGILAMFLGQYLWNDHPGNKY